MSGKTLQRYAVGISLVTLCIAIWLTSFIWPLQPESINSPSFGQKLPDVNDAWNTTSNHTSKTDSTDVGYYHHHHHRRDPHLVMSYAYAICKGGLLWQRVEDALAGRAPAGPHFTDQDFNNGWTDHPLPRPAKIKEHWLDAFVSFAHNRPPRAEEIVTLNAVQDKSFRVETGASVNTPTNGRYLLNYIPDWSALLVVGANSPKNRLNDTHDRVYPQPPRPQDIPDLIPPLNRLSDMSWYWMSKHGNPARIRYIGHDWIANADTESIIDYLVTVKFGRRDPILDWPGLVYNLTSKEGKALLATPNGLAVAWMMVERAAALGRRQPKTPIGAEYYINAIPFYSAIIVVLATSLIARLLDTEEPVDSGPLKPALSDIPSLIPPLNRLSDMQFFYYSTRGNPSHIRYIGHEWITNHDTNSIIYYLFTAKFGKPDPDQPVPWPGLVFDITSEEGMALLATPNGLGVAWMLIDHAKAFGWRKPRVHIFVGDLRQNCMLWNLAPM